MIPMMIKPDGTIHFLTVREHLQRKTIVYQDQERTIHLNPRKNPAFLFTEGQGAEIYIDLFTLYFGQKERLNRRISGELMPIRYGCKRCERDKILYLPAEEVIDEQTKHNCSEECQYYSPPVGIKGQYAFNCILVRYRAIGLIDRKVGLTLEDISRIYGCTRERIRQIEEKAMRKMRHITRSHRLQVFCERTFDYRDYFISNTEQIA